MANIPSRQSSVSSVVSGTVSTPPRQLQIALHPESVELPTAPVPPAQDSVDDELLNIHPEVFQKIRARLSRKRRFKFSAPVSALRHDNTLTREITTSHCQEIRAAMHPSTTPQEWRLLVHFRAPAGLLLEQIQEKIRSGEITLTIIDGGHRWKILTDVEQESGLKQHVDVVAFENLEDLELVMIVCGVNHEQRLAPDGTSYCRTIRRIVKSVALEHQIEEGIPVEVPLPFHEDTAFDEPETFEVNGVEYRDFVLIRQEEVEKIIRQFIIQYPWHLDLLYTTISGSITVKRWQRTVQEVKDSKQLRRYIRIMVMYELFSRKKEPYMFDWWNWYDAGEGIVKGVASRVALGKGLLELKFGVSQMENCFSPDVKENHALKWAIFQLHHDAVRETTRMKSLSGKEFLETEVVKKFVTDHPEHAATLMPPLKSSPSGDSAVTPLQQPEELEQNLKEPSHPVGEDALAASGGPISESIDIPSTSTPQVLLALDAGGPSTRNNPVVKRINYSYSHKRLDAWARIRRRQRNICTSHSAPQKHRTTSSASTLIFGADAGSDTGADASASIQPVQMDTEPSEPQSMNDESTVTADNDVIVIEATGFDLDCTLLRLADAQCAQPNVSGAPERDAMPGAGNLHTLLVPDVARMAHMQIACMGEFIVSLARYAPNSLQQFFFAAHCGSSGIIICRLSSIVTAEGLPVAVADSFGPYEEESVIYASKGQQVRFSLMEGLPLRPELCRFDVNTGALSVMSTQDLYDAIILRFPVTALLSFRKEETSAVG